jgi:hypothetical protein
MKKFHTLSQSYYPKVPKSPKGSAHHKPLLPGILESKVFLHLSETELAS